MPEVGRKKHFDVFLSYRHQRGDGYARSIRDALKDRGLRVYLDVDDWKKPIFDVELLERIAEAPNFVAVLTPNSLDDCHDPKDWLRREIACAVSTKRRIVPVLFPDFKFPPTTELPEDIQILHRFDGVTYNHELFNGMVDKLIGMMILPPRPLWRRPLVAIAFIGLLAFATWIYVLRVPKRTIYPQPTKQELELQQEEQLLRAGRRFDEAVAKDEEIAKLRGALEKYATNEIETIRQLQRQESSLMADAKTAESQDDLSRAHVDYQKVMDLHGARELEAFASLNIVRQKMGGASEADILKQDFASGVAAFKRGEYSVAKTHFDQVLGRSPQNWPKRAQAADYQRWSGIRMQQQQNLSQAQTDFVAKNYDAAQKEAKQVINASDADPAMVRQAQDLIARIPASPSVVLGNPQPIVTPEVQGMTRDAENLIQEGQYKAAWSKATAIEQSKGDATSLRQAIRAAEDSKFQELTSRFTSANKKNRSELQDLLGAFQQFANNAATKESEARREVDQIAGEIAALDNSRKDPIETAVSVDDPSAIQRTLDRYAEAVASGDLERVKAVRQLKGNEEKRMIESLKATKGKGYALRNCSHPEITGDNARLSCDSILTGSKDTPPGHVTFLLKRIYNQWFILSSN